MKGGVAKTQTKRRIRNSDGPSSSCNDVEKGFQCNVDVSHYWGQYSPYFTVPSQISAEVPEHCEITFAQVLSRHGARDPTAGKTLRYRQTIEHIQSTSRRFPGKYHFLKNYRYTLGADQLTPFGEEEMVNSGSKFYQRYRALAKDSVPFIRSAGQHRVVESAQNWTQGFHAASLADGSSPGSDGYPYDILIINEGPDYNNTLSHDSCRDYTTKIAEEAQSEWSSIFTGKIVDRLNRKLPGTGFTAEHAIDLMDLCPFETVASRVGQMSKFCRLFSASEWQDYDYYQSLGKYYGFANGNPLGATQGVGFVNELIARLTHKAVVDDTTINSTLDGSEETFPISDNVELFADFSHDNDMSNIFAALGLYNATSPPPRTERQTPLEMVGYAASWSVPFAARAYFEKMKCSDHDEEFVRVLVNDRVIPLSSCQADGYGRCTISKFVESLSYARSGGDWDKCFL